MSKSITPTSFLYPVIGGSDRPKNIDFISKLIVTPMKHFITLLLFCCLVSLPSGAQVSVSDLQKAAQNGNAAAQNSLGVCYANGQGVTQSYTEAVKWYRKAADQGYAVAQNNLGGCYANGQGVTQSYAEAVKWYRKAADQGYADAQNRLGVCYYNGQGVTQSYAEAVKWFRKVADQGDADAQFNLGVCYYNGQGVTQSYAEAVKWYRKAADQGLAAAQSNLGVCYFNGQGVTQSDTEAVKWFRKAADQDYATAQAKLGLCYEYGYGVTKSSTESAKWFRLAEKNGYDVSSVHDSEEDEEDWFDDLDDDLDDDWDDDYDYLAYLLYGKYEKYKKDSTAVSKETTQTKPTTSTVTTSSVTSSSNTSTSSSVVPSTTTTYSTKQKKHHRVFPFNTPYWETRPWGFSIGYVQKQWVYKTLPEYASELGSIVERYGVFSEDGEAKVANGLQVGIRYEPQFQYGFGLNTGIFYEGYYDKSNDYSDSEGNYNLEWLEHSINIPFHVEFRANFKEGFQFFVYGGASVDVGISSTITFHDLSSGYDYEPIDIYGDKYEMKRFNASWEAGAGLRFYGIQLQGQFSRGLINMASHGSDYSVMQDKPLSISLSFMF